MLEVYEAHYLTLTAEPNETTQRRKFNGNHFFNNQEQKCPGDVLLQETFCIGDVVCIDVLVRRHCVYGDVLSRRRFVCVPSNTTIQRYLI
jgi:hypothetical protein